jgi:hypothetical protein
MKVWIGPYTDWIGPYQIADWLENLCVLERDRKAIGDWLAKTWVMDFCQWIASKKKRLVYIKADNYDSWNADVTMAMLVLPIMKDLKKNKQGAGFIDDADVPEELRSTNAPPKENDWDTDDNWFKRYEWVMDEVIWALEQMQPDVEWDEQYWIVHPEIDWTVYPEDEGKNAVPLRWQVEGKCDWDGRKAHSERIDNGLRLLGTYWRNFWD